MKYREYIKKRIKILVRMGYLPQDAMRIAAMEWRSGFRTANPKKVYRTVAIFPSKSKSGKVYTVKVDKKGNFSCDCPRWIFARGGVRTCPHVEAVKRGMNPTNHKLLKYAIEFEPIKAARQLGYQVTLLSPKRSEDRSDYMEGYRIRLTKERPGEIIPEIVIARSNKDIATFLKRKLRLNPTIFDTLFGKPKNLYESFHGNLPRVRQVKIRVPNKGEKLVAIGKLMSVEYQPYGSSKRKRVHYTHSFGDYGYKVEKNKPVLAVSSDGKQLMILNEQSDYKFGKRGIVG